MADNKVRQLNRVISIINTIDKIAVDEDLESLDRLQLVYNSVQIIKQAIGELCMEVEGDSTLGFRPSSKEE
mgnify:FL=1